MDTVPEKISHPAVEEEILKYWKQIDAFQTSLKRSEGKPLYSFYDGPPFATGLPHYGHILAGTIKDTVTRYAHQTGHHVERRFGWDCHGLPIEFEINKEIGIKTREEVLRMGIPKYNAHCRAIVMRYSAEWETIVTRLGRWIDFRNDYKTLDPGFMESVWWVFSEIYKKGLVYKGFKVMPYSTGVTTPLSNFEANLDYRDVSDPAVYVSFPLADDAATSMIAWTTTPWTLPSNLALCVNPQMTYVKLVEKKTGAQYIMLEARVAALFPDPALYEIKEKFAGSTLQGRKYTPLFPYFQAKERDGAFQIVCDTYVTAESGTGIVHCAPAFGEDDYRVCMAAGIIEKGKDIPCPVNEDGHFTEEVTDFVGQYVKAADKPIVEYLKKMKRVVKKEEYKHSYPFCWRSGTPLLYKAVPSWFVAVESIRDRLVACNNPTYWVPDNVKEKKFHNWLHDARDWTISRSRFWGTPLPIWTSEDGEEIVVIGSIKELEDLSGIRVTDLHRESVDHITIPSKQGKGVLRRVDEVFDCWFESGSMPYAQQHYPFENKDKFEKSFPANFIAEGIDQTRGWFYTLLVLSTILFDKPPFQNLVVNGLVLAADGRKMSKSLRNYPDPMHVVNAFGADALRLYLIKSPAVRAENLKFQQEGVSDIIKDVFRPWFNAYRFFVEAVHRYNKGRAQPFKPDLALSLKCTNIMDRWIQAATNGLIVFVRKEMEAYRLDTVVPRLVRFIDQLTNWYVRLNRKRMKGSEGDADWLMSLSVFFEVLMVINRAMSPFTPFLTEYFYQNMRKVMQDKEDSIHYLDFPEPQKEALDPRIEEAVGHVQDVINLARAARDRRTRPIKYPLQSVTVFHKSDVYLKDVMDLKPYILTELNVKDVIVTKDENLVIPIARADRNKLGKKLRGDAGKVAKAISELAPDRIRDLMRSGSIDIEGHTIHLDEVEITQQFQGDKAKFEPAWNDEVVVILDIQENDSLTSEKTAREIVNRIQKLRKKAKVHPNDPIEVYYEIRQDPDRSLEKALAQQLEFITSGVNGIGVGLYPAANWSAGMGVIQEGEGEIEKSKMDLKLVRRNFGFDDKAFGDVSKDDVDAIKTYFWSRDYDRLAKELEKGSVDVRIGEKKVQVRLGKEIFLTASARK